MTLHNKYLVLNYHRLEEETSCNDEFVVRPSDFFRQLDLIKQLNLPGYLAGENVSAAHAETGIAITFDDGNETDFTIAVPALRERGMKATFFPIVNEIVGPLKMDAPQIRQLSENGFAIGSHGMNHTELTSLSHDEQSNEMRQSLTELCRIVQKEIRSFAFPYGIYNSSLATLAEESGYCSAMTTEALLNDANDHSFLIHRWNIKRSTSMEEFREMISGNGKLPRLAVTKQVVKRYARRFIGTEQLAQLRRFTNRNSHD